MLTFSKLLLLVAVILFVLAGIGFESFHLGTVAISLLAFGLACFAASFWNKA